MVNAPEPMPKLKKKIGVPKSKKKQRKYKTTQTFTIKYISKGVFIISLKLHGTFITQSSQQSKFCFVNF